MRGARVSVVRVDLGARGYDVRIEQGLIERAAALLPDRAFVVSDETVWAAQGARLGLADPILVPPGEASKDWTTLAALVDRLLAAGIARGDTIVAFGGGMVGDLAGFAAAIVKRGVMLVQVPTSLLAQVDSSVGGKTGINIAAGKNLVGAFHQPSMVLIDPLALDTLPERELRAGYAEIVKYGLIGDADFFAWCEAHGAALIAGDAGARLHAIETAVRAKADVVAEDEREAGRRALLNLGHSFGHAMEIAAGYAGLLHGEAVAVGMTLAYRFSAARGVCGEADADRVAAHLAAVGLPTTLRVAGIDASGADLAAHMRHDKKNTGDAPRLILARGIGDAFIDDGADWNAITTFLDAERER